MAMPDEAERRSWRPERPAPPESPPGHPPAPRRRWIDRIWRPEERNRKVTKADLIGIFVIPMVITAVSALFTKGCEGG